jgi:hypothetical protein
MVQQKDQSKIKIAFNSGTGGKKSTFPENLFLDESLPQVNVILVNQSKKNKIKTDPNELLMEFHCEV